MLKTILFMVLYSPILMYLQIFIILMFLKNKNQHPISMMIILIFLTFLITLLMNFIYYSLMALILFLAMIGGLLIIYMYITSLTNNSFFHFNLKEIILYTIKILPLMILTLMTYLFLPNNYFNMINIQDSWSMNYLFFLDQTDMNILFNENTYKSTLFIMLYLYYTMICIMNICYKLKSPLRQLTY